MNIDKEEKVKKAINELRDSYELHQRGWAKRCLDTIEEELETYKKIVEHLAEEVERLDDRLSAEIGNYIKGYCNIENGCIFNYKRKCSECIIDWARKEVDKNGNIKRYIYN